MSYISEIFRIIVFNLKISIINQLAIYLWVVSGFVAYVYFTNLLAKYRMKIKYLLILAFLFMVAGCHHKQSNANPENDSIVNIREMGIADTTTISDDDERIVHAKMGYYDFDQIENLVSFFDSILAKHPIPIWLPEEDTTNQRVKRCVARIEAYRKGKAQFFPDTLISECLRSISFNTAIVNNHGPEYTDMVYGECLMMCAAFYSPDITCLVEMQTPDHCAGIFNYGTSYNRQPWWSYLFLKRKKGYEAICLGDFVAVRSIFQLEDAQKRKYYLCSDNNTSLEFNQWLYWVKGEDDIRRVAECHKAPMEGDVESYYFDKNRLIWKYAKWDETKKQLISTSDKPAMTLRLNGERSGFE